MNRLRRYWHTTLRPALYHGHSARPPFFEGWYFKLVSADERQRFAIIPGVFLGENGHAFIQVLDGISGQSDYHSFPLSAFTAAPDRFEVHIAGSEFSQDRIRLRVDTELGRVAGEVAFQGGSPWPVSWRSPGVMGWYAWTPRMECYHGVLSFDHALQGALEIQGQPVDFTGGRGYIEKDWGQSFPQAWVWFQSNHFSSPATCLTASIAIIPWLGSAFRGFIIGLWRNGTLHRFASYTGARTDKLEISDQAVHWVVSDSRQRLEMTARRAEGGLLLGPTRAEMGKRVNETLRAEVSARLTTRSGATLFEDSGRNAGLEVHGDLPRLLKF